MILKVQTVNNIHHFKLISSWDKVKFNLVSSLLWLKHIKPLHFPSRSLMKVGMWTTIAKSLTLFGVLVFDHGKSELQGLKVEFATAFTLHIWSLYGSLWVSWQSFTSLTSKFLTIWSTVSWIICQGKLNKIEECQNNDKFSECFSSSLFWQILVCIFTAFIYWVVICLTMRYTLKLLLMYKGWMYETRGSGSKTSLQTKLWAVLVKGEKLILEIFPRF